MVHAKKLSQVSDYPIRKFDVFAPQNQILRSAGRLHQGTAAMASENWSNYRSRSGKDSVVYITLIAVAALAATAQAQSYDVGQPHIYNNDTTGSLFPLDSDGLSGRFTGFTSNASAINRTFRNITFHLCFLTYDSHHFFLSLIAMQEPSRLWQLYRPIVLWTANRNPSDYVRQDATLDFGRDGDLVLRDYDGRLVWSTNTAGKNVTGLYVSNLGNILLWNSTEYIVWQTFDMPTDTYAMQAAIWPGTRLVSWASGEDSSEGAYSLVMGDAGLALYFNSEKYWSFELEGMEESGSSGGLFAAVCYQENGFMSLDLYNNATLSGMRGRGQGFLSLQWCNASRPLRRWPMLQDDGLVYGTFFKLTSDGDIAVYTWDYDLGDERWYAAYNLSTNSSCLLPGQCGPYGVCDRSRGQCTDRCPETFSYQDGVCNSTRPTLMLSSPCSSQRTEIIEMESVDYFVTSFGVRMEMSREECRRSCEVNCSCVAAFYNSNSCFQTHEPLQSMKDGEYTAFLKVAAMPLTSDSTSNEDEGSRRVLRVSLPVLLSALLLLSLALAWILWKKSRGDDELPDKEEEELEMSLMDCMPRRFTYRELEQITGNFSKCLGQGGFGSVYRGCLDDTVQVAVKKLEGSTQTSRDFYAEVASLARTNHVNLVKFMGFCAEGPRKRLLVYEFVPNGSLEKWIFTEGEAADILEQEQNGLSWDVKFKIAIGTAWGLSYLHEECAQRIVHLDLKPENILVDVGFVPKISDFGLSKLMNREVTYLQMTSMRGTPGYLAPEYLQVGTITEKSDVFSFGVLLLEMVTGRRNKYLSSDYLSRFSQIYHEKKFDSSKSKKMFYESYRAAGADQLITVAYLCLQDDPELRPSMSTVVKMLEGLIQLPEMPPSSSLHFFLGYRSKVKLPVWSTSSPFSTSSGLASSSVNPSYPSTRSFLRD